MTSGIHAGSQAQSARPGGPVNWFGTRRPEPRDITHELHLPGVGSAGRGNQHHWTGRLKGTQALGIGDTDKSRF